MGREISTLKNEMLFAGEHSISVKNTVSKKLCRFYNDFVPDNFVTVINTSKNSLLKMIQNFNID